MAKIRGSIGSFQVGPAERKHRERHDHQREMRNAASEWRPEPAEITITFNDNSDAMKQLAESMREMMGIGPQIDHEFNRICLEAAEKKAAREEEQSTAVGSGAAGCGGAEDHPVGG